jgi:hypothetical protein
MVATALDKDRVLSSTENFEFVSNESEAEEPTAKDVSVARRINLSIFKLHIF